MPTVILLMALAKDILFPVLLHRDNGASDFWSLLGLGYWRAAETKRAMGFFAWVFVAPSLFAGSCPLV